MSHTKNTGFWFLNSSRRRNHCRHYEHYETKYVSTYSTCNTTKMNLKCLKSDWNLSKTSICQKTMWSKSCANITTDLTESQSFIILPTSHFLCFGLLIRQHSWGNCDGCFTAFCFPHFLLMQMEVQVLVWTQYLRSCCFPQPPFIFLPNVALRRSFQPCQTVPLACAPGCSHQPFRAVYYSELCMSAAKFQQWCSASFIQLAVLPCPSNGFYWEASQ